MATEIATLILEGSTEQIVREAGTEIRKRLKSPPTFIVFFNSTSQGIEQLGKGLQSSFPNATVIGCTTAGEFTEKEDRKQSVSVFALAGSYAAEAGIGKGLKENPERAVKEALSQLQGTSNGFPYVTAIVLLDPLSGKGEEATLLVVQELLQRFGKPIPVAGGAAGDDLKMKQTRVFARGKAETNAIVVALLYSEKPLAIGVCHGHRVLSEPLKVTRAEGNVVYEIEGRPAFEVWKEKTREDAGARGIRVESLADPSAIGAFLLQYEAGLQSGQELKIRAPLSVDEKGGIAFACGIPQGAVIRITKSRNQDQVESAREAARRARSALKGKAAGALVFDCICRNLILSQEFRSAVTGIAEELGNVPLAGFETYGEIAMEVGDFSGFHNTTTVVLAFPE